MNIPDTFKNAVKNAFYDKHIDVCTCTKNFDDEGDYYEIKTDIINSFNGNVSFSNFKAVKEQYGIDYNIDITITTGIENNDKFNLNDLISYQNITYEITDKIVCDSHILAVGKIWGSR